MCPDSGCSSSRIFSYSLKSGGARAGKSWCCLQMEYSFLKSECHMVTCASWFHLDEALGTLRPTWKLHPHPLWLWRSLRKILPPLTSSTRYDLQFWWRTLFQGISQVMTTYHEIDCCDYSVNGFLFQLWWRSHEHCKTSSPLKPIQYHTSYWSEEKGGIFLAAWGYRCCFLVIVTPSCQAFYI